MIISTGWREELNNVNCE